jgi:mono/diheme cytochrome c family protein
VWATASMSKSRPVYDRPESQRKTWPETLSVAKILLVGMLVALFLGSVSPALAAPAAQDATAQPPDPSAGQQSYGTNCAPCHGAAGKGDGPTAAGLDVKPTAFADYAAIADLPLTEWFGVAKNGRMDRMMPPWGQRLNDQQIWDTVGYAWTLHTSPAQVEMGKAVYEANCASCHGLDGKGTSPMPDFTDFAATAQVAQSSWEQVVKTGQGGMPAFGEKLSEPEQRAALEYVRSLSLGPMFQEQVQSGTGVITGTVINGTTGAPMPGLNVALGVFDGETVVARHSTTSAADGSYRFEGLPTDPKLVFVAGTEYPAGLRYSSDIAGFEAGKETLSLPISVYETTSDGSGLRADRVHIIIEPEPGQLQVAELIVFSLDGNRTYVGDGTGVLRFTLPAGAANLALSDGQLGEASDETARYVRTPDGFVDRAPLSPGQGVRQVLYRYSLPYAGQSLDLVRSFPYPAAGVNVLVSDQGERVTSSKELTDQGMRSTQSGSFFTLLGENVPAGQPMTISMKGLPSGTVTGTGSSAATASRPLLILLVVLAGVGAGALVAWPLLRRRAAARGTASWDSASPEGIDQDGLIDALARLQVAFEAGDLSESAYRDQRLRLKAQLGDLEREQQSQRPSRTAG